MRIGSAPPPKKKTPRLIGRWVVCRWLVCCWFGFRRPLRHKLVPWHSVVFVFTTDLNHPWQVSFWALLGMRDRTRTDGRTSLKIPVLQIITNCHSPYHPPKFNCGANNRPPPARWDVCRSFWHLRVCGVNSACAKTLPSTQPTAPEDATGWRRASRQGRGRTDGRDLRYQCYKLLHIILLLTIPPPVP